LNSIFGKNLKDTNPDKWNRLKKLAEGETVKADQLSRIAQDAPKDIVNFEGELGTAESHLRRLAERNEAAKAQAEQAQKGPLQRFGENIGEIIGQARTPTRGEAPVGIVDVLSNIPVLSNLGTQLTDQISGQARQSPAESAAQGQGLFGFGPQGSPVTTAGVPGLAGAQPLNDDDLFQLIQELQ